DNFGLPFRGIIALWSDLSAGRYYPQLWEMRRGILCFSILVIAAAALSWKMFRDSPGAVTTTAAIFGAMSICFNLRSVWVETAAAERLTSDLFVFLAVATPEFIGKSKA